MISKRLRLTQSFLPVARPAPASLQTRQPRLDNFVVPFGKIGINPFIFLSKEIAN
jgi:hypothetical protein